MTRSNDTALDILDHLRNHDLWSIGVQEVCHAIAKALGSRKYGLIKKNGRIETLELNKGISPGAFWSLLGRKEKPLFSMPDGKATYLFYFLDTKSDAMTARERSSINIVLAMIAKAQNQTYSQLDDMGHSQYLNSSISVLGEQASSRTRHVTLQTQVLESLDMRRQSISGVSRDEELINLNKFQHGYQAAARLFQTVNNLLDTTLQLGA